MTGRQLFGRWLMARLSGPWSVSNAGLSRVMGLPTTTSGQDITPETAMNLSAVFCAVNLFANALGTLPWIVYRRDANNDSERATDHPAYRLLKRLPNEQMTVYQFKQLLMRWVLLWGSGRAEIQRDGMGRPVALWPIHPSRVSVEQDADGNLIHVVLNNSGTATRLADIDVLHCFGHSVDGLTGRSVLTHARESLGNVAAAEQYGGAFFGNDARPAVVLKHPQVMNEEAEKSLRQSWKEAYGGVKRGGVAVLQQGMELQAFGMPNDDAQFLETRQFGVIEIARWFNVPPNKLMDFSQAHYNNIEQADLGWLRDSVDPWCVNFAQEADRKLLTESEVEQEYKTEFMWRSALKTDITSRNNSYATMRQWGILSANEWRRLEDMPSIGPDGDVRLIPANYVPDAQPGSNVAAPAQPEPQQPRQASAWLRPLCVDVAEQLCRMIDRQWRECAVGTDWSDWFGRVQADHEKKASVCMRRLCDAVAADRNVDAAGWLDEIVCVYSAWRASAEPADGQSAEWAVMLENWLRDR